MFLESIYIAELTLYNVIVEPLSNFVILDGQTYCSHLATMGSMGKILAFVMNLFTMLVVSKTVPIILNKVRFSQ